MSQGRWVIDLIDNIQETVKSKVVNGGSGLWSLGGTLGLYPVSEDRAIDYLFWAGDPAPKPALRPAGPDEIGSAA
jgi:hypothetical protein